MEKIKHLFFIALLPPKEVQQSVINFQNYFGQIYNSSSAKKSPPHLTLQPPFRWNFPELPLLEEKLQEFALTQCGVPIILNGFGAFKPRVIYINVVKTPELMFLQEQLKTMFKSQFNIEDKQYRNQIFTPHITVAFRDLTRDNFYKAWPEFKQKELHFRFTVPQLTLLHHNGERWEIIKEFQLPLN